MSEIERLKRIEAANRRIGVQDQCVGSVWKTKQGEREGMSELTLSWDLVDRYQRQVDRMRDRLVNIEAAARALVDAIHASGDVDISQQVNALVEALEATP